jgi:hypothetical protein
MAGRMGRFAIGEGTKRVPDAANDGDKIPVCVLTRFALRSPLSVPRLYVAYRQIIRDARQVRGFRAASFQLGGIRTVVILSIWSDFTAIPAFGTISKTHLGAAKWAMTQVTMMDGPGIWSTRWQLNAASNNLNWPGVDFSSFESRSEHGVVREL